jgi:hypothetical protein
MRLLKYFLLFFTAALSSTTYAANNVTVGGKITPSGCTASFDGGADLDWGAIPWTTLFSTQMTTLEAKQVTLKVSCPTGSKVGMAFWVGDDPNQNSALPGPDTRSKWNHSQVTKIFGLGADPLTKEKIGNFVIIGMNSSYDGVAQKSYYGYVSSTAHTETSFSSAYMGDAVTRGQDWAVWNTEAGKTAVAADYTFTFDVEPQLNMRTKLTATEEVPFAGSAQFNVRYF